MNVALTPEVKQFIEEKVKAGFYHSPEEAVNHLLSNVAHSEQPTEQPTADDIEELRAAIDIGIAEADRGDFAEFTVEDIIAEGRARLSTQRKGV